ncbi:MAG: flippase-like domain-containing protein [Anaerolineae bacterium]|nr:flippase-like domain-containing protein [Anaerolineae bacterium]
MSVERSQQKRNRILTWVINLAGVAVFAFILYQGGVEVWRQIFQADLLYLLGALAATLAWNLVAAYRWYLIAAAVTEGQPGCTFSHYYTYHMIGMLTGQILPIGVGMLGGRPVALSLSGKVSLRRAALSVVLDKLFDVVLAVLLAVPAALYLVDWIDLPATAALIGCVVLLGLILIGWQYESTMRWLAQLAARLARPLTRLPIIGRRLISRLPQQLDRLSAETFVTNRRAVQLFLLTLVLYSLLSLRLALIALAVHLAVPWYLLALGVGITQLTLIFSFTPGSLGVLEGGWWAIFRLGGQTLDVYNLFVIARRALVLVFTLICALLGFTWIRESPARLFRSVLSASRQPAEEAQNVNPNVTVK